MKIENKVINDLKVYTGAFWCFRCNKKWEPGCKGSKGWCSCEKPLLVDEWMKGKR